MEGDNKKRDSSGSFDNLDFDSIECPGTVFKRLLWKDYRQSLINILIGCVALLIFVILTGYFVLIVFVILIPVVGAISYFEFIQNKSKTLFMKEFAKRNGLSYESSIQINDVVGNFLKVGCHRAIAHVLTGSYRGQKARLFHYIYFASYDNDATLYGSTVMEIFFERTEFPYILLYSTKGHWMEIGGYRGRGENERRIRLEEEFEKSFNLFAEDGYGVEVMQIFNQDFLRFLRERASNFSIELQGNRIYIYDDVLVEEKKQLQEFFEVTDSLVERIVPLLNRLDSDFAVLHSRYKKER